MNWRLVCRWAHETLIPRIRSRELRLYGAFRSVCACRTESQFSQAAPLEAPFRRMVPLASSGFAKAIGSLVRRGFSWRDQPERLGWVELEVV
jgi:hypothetical protein